MSRTEQLNIYLLKTDVQAWSDAIRQNVEYTQLALPGDMPENSIMLLRNTPPHPPSWVRYFPQSAQGPIQRLIAASAGAVLLFPSCRRWFAACFGTGWHLLRKDSFVRSFGLKAALSVIKQDTLKAVDISTYENFAKHRRISTSKGTTIDSFDIEGQLDLLRGVVGDCGRATIAKQIGGRDACVIWTHIAFSQLPKLCGILLKLYESSRVNRRYPLVNNVSEVRDPAKTQRLNDLLDAQISVNRHLDISIAAPEVVDWQNVAAFALDHVNSPLPSVSITFADIRVMFRPNPPSCAEMQQIQLGTRTPAGTPGLQEWTLYECLVTEIDDPGNQGVRYILMAGQWYEVAASYAAQVIQDISSVLLHGQVLPNAIVNETEEQYNKRLVQTNPTNLMLLDRKNISYGGGSSRIEVCDVLSASSYLYHIKDYHGSATLSHLFAQGTVSSRLLLEQEFRQAILDKYPALPANVIQANRISPANIEVVYGIICEPARIIPDGLPFFSKVRLLESVRELRRMGYANVSLAKIARPLT